MAEPRASGRAGGRGATMKLGIAIEWAGAQLDIPIQRIQLAEELGFDSVWTAEAYGSDAMTPLAYIAAHTQRLRLGTGVAQLAARPPAAAAMAANTVDALAGRGRMIFGLGLSGPQIVEGWYGQPWGQPHQRLREYVDIVRAALRREEPLAYDGEVFSLPYRGAGSAGMGKPLRSILHTRAELPIWLGTGSQRNVELTAEIADGWLPFGFVPGMLEQYRPWLETGFRRAGSGKSLRDFEIQAGCQVHAGDDVAKALAKIKPMHAFYVGGMGHPKRNFHRQLMERRGYAETAARVHELFAAGRRDEAALAIPDEYVDDGALVGPPARIVERLARWRDSGVTGLTLHGADDDSMRLIASATRAAA